MVKPARIRPKTPLEYILTDGLTQVSVSDDRSSWSMVECGTTFPGNTDMDTQVFTYFAYPVSGRYVRIHPQTW